MYTNNEKKKTTVEIIMIHVPLSLNCGSLSFSSITLTASVILVDNDPSETRITML